MFACVFVCMHMCVCVCVCMCVCACAIVHAYNILCLNTHFSHRYMYVGSYVHNIMVLSTIDMLYL